MKIVETVEFSSLPMQTRTAASFRDRFFQFQVPRNTHAPGQMHLTILKIQIRIYTTGYDGEEASFVLCANDKFRFSPMDSQNILEGREESSY